MAGYRVGDVIMRSEPWIYSLHPKFLKDYCYHCMCLMEFRQSVKCDHCEYCFYCSKECQNEDWKERHGDECKLLQSLPEKGLKLTHNLLIMLKAIFRIKKGEIEEDTALSYPPTGWNFESLISHQLGIKKDLNRMQLIKKLYKKLKRTLDRVDLPDLESFINIFGRIRVNSCEIRNEFLQRIGEGVYFGQSSIDHACCRNAVYQFEGPIVIIKAVQNIPKSSDVRISYAESLMPGTARLKELQDWFFFDCECSLCSPAAEKNLQASFTATFDKAAKLDQSGKDLLALHKYSEALECIERSTPVVRHALSEFDSQVGLQLLTLALLKLKVIGVSEDVVEIAAEAQRIFAISDGKQLSLYKNANLLVFFCTKILENQLHSHVEENQDHRDRLSYVRNLVDKLLPVMADVLRSSFCMKSCDVFYNGEEFQSQL